MEEERRRPLGGQLYGAKYGRGSLPFDAVYRVDGLEALLEVAGEWGRVRRIEKL